MFGKGLRKSLEEELLLGRDSIFQKLEDLLEVHCPICLFTFFLSLDRPKALNVGWKKIQRDFLCGGGSLVRKLHLVNWRTVS